MRKQSSFDDEVTSLSSAAMHLPKKCSYQTSTQLNAFYSPCADALPVCRKLMLFFRNEHKDHISCMLP